MAKNHVRMRSPRLPWARFAMRVGEGLKRVFLEGELTLLGFERSPPNRVLMESCWRRDPVHAYCGRCGRTVLSPGEECRHCRNQRLPHVRVVRLGSYEEPLSSWVRAVKFSGWEAMGQELGVQLARSFEEAFLDRGDVRTVVVPVPMPRLRRMVRGIDHAHVLARGFAAALQLPMRQPMWHGRGFTQATRTAAQRARRKSPFTPRRFSRSLKGFRVVLVDDVLTSGRTARAAARQIRQLGVKEVVIAVIAVADTPLSLDSGARGNI